MRKSRSTINLLTAILAVVVLSFTACHKKTTPADTGYANEQATTEKTFNDVQSIADQASGLTSGSNMSYRTTATTTMGCATVTRTPNTITIDFGQKDCTCLDGRTRRGKIIVSYIGNYSDSGSVHTVTFDNYYQNDNKVTGTKTVTNMGHNSLGQPVFSVVVNGSVTLAGGGTITADWTRTRTWTAGYNTPLNFTDDEYSVSGSGTLVRADGAHVAVSIPVATPLIFAYGCRWIEAGTITFTVGGSSRSLNYGNTPACDDQAVLTLANGSTYNITLH